MGVATLLTDGRWVILLNEAREITKFRHGLSAQEGHDGLRR